MPQPQPRRDSVDWEERVEWQLNQIRINTLIVGLLAGLVMVGAILTALG